MKSKNLHKSILSKYQNSDGPTKTFRNFPGRLCLKTGKRQCKMIERTESVIYHHMEDAHALFEQRELFKKQKTDEREKFTNAVRTSFRKPF